MISINTPLLKKIKSFHIRNADIRHSWNQQRPFCASRRGPSASQRPTWFHWKSPSVHQGAVKVHRRLPSVQGVYSSRQRPSSAFTLLLLSLAFQLRSIFNIRAILCWFTIQKFLLNVMFNSISVRFRTNFIEMKRRISLTLNYYSCSW